MKIIESNMLDKHEDVEYLYVFHDLASHKDKADIRYAISKTYYFLSNEIFYKQHEMLQEVLDAKDFKDESAVLDHIGKLNKEQLSSTQKKRAELKAIQGSAPASSSISDLITYHDEVIGVLLEWFNLKGLDQKDIPLFLSKWAKEVVRLLIKNGEMKHQDILLALRGLPTSYNHISKIFKTKDAKEFLKSKIINNQSYYSLRDPSQFKK